MLCLSSKRETINQTQFSFSPSSTPVLTNYLQFSSNRSRNLLLSNSSNFLGNNTPLGCTSQFAKTIEGNNEEEKSGVVKDIVGHVERGP